MLSLNPYTSFFYDIEPGVQNLSQTDRKRLFTICKDILDDVNLRRYEDVRLSAVEVLVALVPDSVDTIKRHINAKKDRYDYEIHFSFFCFLDEVPDLPGGEEFAKEIPPLIEKYLMELRRDTAHTAFMAGDLLGDHWDLEESLPILMRLATSARFAAGRDGAVQGLEQALKRLKDPDKEKSILALLRKIARSDRSEGVQTAARLAIRFYKDHIADTGSHCKGKESI
jgi:hypothetical protein